MLTGMFVLKRAKIAGGWRNVYNEQNPNMLFTEHYYNNQIKEHVLGKECRTFGRHKSMRINFFLENLQIRVCVTFRRR